MTHGQPTAVPVPVPQAAQVQELLQTLTGCDVEVGAGRPVLPERDPAVAAVYVTHELVPGAVVACELSLAAYAGAALGEVPAGEADDCLALGRLSDELTENVAEVLNVLSAAFTGPGAPAVRLGEVYAAGDRVPAEVGSVLRYVVRRADLQISITGYGVGRMSVVAIG